MDVREQILELVKQADPANPQAFVHDIVRDLGRQKLDSYIAECEDCQICSEAKSLTRGKADAAVMIIGESVAEEQIGGEQYVLPFAEGTDSGEVLDKVLDMIGVNTDEIFYMNTISCWPHKEVGNEIVHRTPTQQEVTNCSVFLDFAIDTVKPVVIIALGSVAYNRLKKEKGVITKDRGEWFEYKGIPVIPTYHPGYFKQIEGKKTEEEVNAIKWDFFNDVRKGFLYIQENFPDNNVLLEPIE
jgi:uracil-DNA glycosylase family 4